MCVYIYEYEKLHSPSLEDFLYNPEQLLDLFNQEQKCFIVHTPALNIYPATSNGPISNQDPLTSQRPPPPLASFAQEVSALRPSWNFISLVPFNDLFSS